MKCRATTKQGNPCRNQAKDKSNYCGIHTRSGKKKGKNRLLCPHCGGTRARALSQIYFNGIRSGSSGAFVTSRGAVGVKSHGSSMTAAAVSAAPPKEEMGFIAEVIMGFGMLLGLVLWFFAAANGNGWSGFFTFLFIAVVGSLIAMSTNSHKNAEERNTERDLAWENTYRCHTCGTEFRW